MRMFARIASTLAVLALSIVSAKSEIPLVPSKWIVTEIAGSPVLNGSSVLIEFLADGTVGGNTGVNRFNGNVVVTGSNVQFDRLRSTRRAGSPELMDQESRFNRALGNTESFSIDAGGILTLLGSSSTPVLRARRDTGQ